jgi:prophage regulatory protein
MTTSPPRLIRLPDVVERTGLSRSSIYAMAAKGAFPALVKLTERSAAWVETEVNDWIAGRIAARSTAAA